MKRYDPEEIVDNLRAAETSPQKVFLQDNSPSTISPRPAPEDQKRQAEGRPAPDSAQGLGEGKPVFSALAPQRIDLPEMPSHLLSIQLLPLLDESVDVASVPPGTRWGFLKRLVQRLFRIVTGKQVNFNRSVANAIHLWAEHGPKVDKALSQILAHLRARDSVLTLMEERFGDINRTHDSLIKGVQETNQRTLETRERIQETNRAVQEMNAGAQAIQRRMDQTLQAAGQVRQLGEEMRRETEARMRRMLHLIREELRATETAGDPLPPKRTSEPGITPPVSRASAEALCENISYLLYEENWRGPKDLIRKWQEEYVRLIEPHLNALPPDKRRVLDVGCGRGEFLVLLNERGIPATGVEINRASANLAREDGLHVESADALDFLEAQPPDTFGAIVAFQVVEHLPLDVLRRFLDLVRAKLAPGGVCVLETLNPGSFSAYRWYFMDPTHQAFLAPETLRLLCECAGLEHTETRMIHPIPEHERLVPAGERAERENVERLNNLLFGCQDYYLMLRKKEERP
jgi:O-antigen chain-terminating methyltransferase